ncbi:neuropeptide CCHamide-1 receptor [Anabrus simplex]|uniref:neuropeptide CCHamide-1 receptor n=1 Tax=Anabrus simplex TaxID=316456 RepID=UPI0034DD8527
MWVEDHVKRIVHIFHNRQKITKTSVTMDEVWTEVDNMSAIVNTNISNTSVTNKSNGEPYTPYHLRPETYIVPVLFAIIFIVGVVGNGALILIFVRHRNMRNVPNTYIFSLALGDLLVIITCVPFTSTVYTFDSWPYGEIICKLSECAKDISIGVSVFTLTALSADRFFAIVDPMRKLHTGGSGRRATRFTIGIVGSIWVLAIALATPAAVTSYIRVHVVNANTTFQACYPYPEELGIRYANGVVITKFVVYYAIPLLIIGVFYTLMARHLILSTRNMPGEMQGQAKQIRARKKVAKMVLSFVIVFAICFFPQHVFMLWFYNYPTAQDDYNEFWHAFRIIGFCLSFVNSCINPIALYCVSGTFRKHFKRYLLCYCCRKRAAARARCGAGKHSRRTSCSLTTSRRHLGTLTSSRRGCYTTRSTWESTTMANFNNGSTLRRHPHSTQLLLHQQDDITITTFMNGGSGLSDITTRT